MLAAITTALALVASVVTAVPTLVDRADMDPRPLHPWREGGHDWCIAVGGEPRLGAPVFLRECATAEHKLWVYSTVGPLYITYIRLAGTDFCLDAGTDVCTGEYNPENGSPAQLAQCPTEPPTPDSVGGVVWDYNRNRYSTRHTSTNFCLDLHDGLHEEGNAVQLWECQWPNLNQHWSHPF